MKRIRLMGLCLIAAFAMAAVAATSASAEAPEYGRCKKVTVKKSGVYGNAGCTTIGGLKANEWEWYPWPTGTPAVNSGYTTTLKEGTVVKLELASGATVICTAEKSAGKVRTNKELDVSSMTFEGCSSAGFPCQSEAQPAGTIVLPYEGNPEFGARLGWVDKSLSKVGALLRPRIEIDFARFECPGAPFGTAFIEGTVTSPVKSGKMLIKDTVKFTAKKGIQKPEAFEGEEPNPLVVGGGVERIGLSMTVIQINQEKLEINPVV
jgi:hypothetical protein